MLDYLNKYIQSSDIHEALLFQHGYIIPKFQFKTCCVNNKWYACILLLSVL